MSLLLLPLLQPCTSFTSSGSERSGDKRQRFQQMRKQHYNMKEAMLKVWLSLGFWATYAMYLTKSCQAFGEPMPSTW